MNILKWYFINPCYTELTQLVIFFATGLLFGAWSWGLGWFLIFILIYEILLIYTTKAEAPYWRFITRLGVNAACLMGWILGRWLLIGETGFEKYC